MVKPKHLFWGYFLLYENINSKTVYFFNYTNIMSRSVKKHLMTKYGGKNRISWKKWKTLINRYNRRTAKQNSLKGEDPYQKDKKLCSWDFDFCK